MVVAFVSVCVFLIVIYDVVLLDVVVVVVVVVVLSALAGGAALAEWNVVKYGEGASTIVWAPEANMPIAKVSSSDYVLDRVASSTSNGKALLSGGPSASKNL